MTRSTRTAPVSATNLTVRGGFAKVRRITIVVVHAVGRARVRINVGRADVGAGTRQRTKVRIGSRARRSFYAVHAATRVVVVTVGIRARPKPAAWVLSDRAARVIERAVLAIQEAGPEVTVGIIGAKGQSLSGYGRGFASRGASREDEEAQASPDDEF